MQCSKETSMIRSGSQVLCSMHPHAVCKLRAPGGAACASAGSVQSDAVLAPAAWSAESQSPVWKPQSCTQKCPCRPRTAGRAAEAWAEAATAGWKAGATAAARPAAAAHEAAGRTASAAAAGKALAAAGAAARCQCVAHWRGVPGHPMSCVHISHLHHIAANHSKPPRMLREILAALQCSASITRHSCHLC